MSEHELLDIELTDEQKAQLTGYAGDRYGADSAVRAAMRAATELYTLAQREEQKVWTEIVTAHGLDTVNYSYTFVPSTGKVYRSEVP